ncbi:hypothetical protein [Streptomyces graminilatus]|uniref:hypothetical protein n=1 Tax=Streptomyces graminilatus TaxID=1464070 RepID=UPI0007C86CFC|nr:hypothetical protein [Streptomyces graminilatus]
MADPTRLQPEDRPDFEAILRLAMSGSDIGRALRGDPTGRTVVRVRQRALANADEIMAATEREYATHLALRAARHGQTGPSTGRGTVLSALAVLTPVVSAVSATALLLLGCTLRLARTAGDLPASLVTAGWVLALVAALSTLVALVALLGTARRQRGGPPTAERVEQARLSWHQALLDRGMLPHLRRYVTEDPPPGTAQPTDDRPGDHPDRPPVGCPRTGPHVRTE